jgi:hypothetical protein
MFTGLNYISPEDKRNFDEGYAACFHDLSGIVKELGKKYYKDFIVKVKDVNTRFGMLTATTTSHHCNCKYCEWDKKE